MGDYITFDRDGKAVVALKGLTRDQMAAISSVETEKVYERQEDGRCQFNRAKFRLHDKRGALVDLGRHLGMFVDKVEFNGPMSIKVLKDDEGV
jgi:phage terminase small subunit